MVFSTVPVYHQDPPNWHLHLQQNLQQENITGDDQQQQLQQQQQQLPPLPPSSYTGGDSGEGSYPGSIRPGSMSDRARLAKIPQPEVALKCPRCESTNTKFCYFNNYSLTQPRHFCKMCRRYWTRGGALRNVPVGGGCRRNKKSKPSSSKSKGGSATTSNSSTSTDQRHKIITSSGSTSTDHVAPRDIDNYMMSSHQNYPQPPQLPFLSSLQNLTHFGNIDPGQTSNINLSADHHQWSNSSSMQQFPFMAGGFDNNVNVPFSFQNGSMPTVMMMTSGASRVCDQVGAGAVKREETLNSGKAARPFLGIVNNEQYYSSPWGGHGGSSSTWNNATGSADGRDDDQMPGQQLNSSAATTHFL